jgi:hypothetical protein
MFLSNPQGGVSTTETRANVHHVSRADVLVLNPVDFRKTDSREPKNIKQYLINKQLTAAMHIKETPVLLAKDAFAFPKAPYPTRRPHGCLNLRDPNIGVRYIDNHTVKLHSTVKVFLNVSKKPKKIALATRRVHSKVVNNRNE